MTKSPNTKNVQFNMKMVRFIEFLNANRELLKDRPQVFQHGDYHIEILY